LARESSDEQASIGRCTRRDVFVVGLIVTHPLGGIATAF
jgi:hypothetical protein